MSLPLEIEGAWLSIEIEDFGETCTRGARPGVGSQRTAWLSYSMP
jgi:hypothetical protein